MKQFRRHDVSLLRRESLEGFLLGRTWRQLSSYYGVLAEEAPWQSVFVIQD
jgi:hypothetical protein